jgi:hypothetical protein
MRLAKGTVRRGRHAYPRIGDGRLLHRGEPNMTDSISLKLVNDSNDANNSQILIFQQNTVANLGEMAVAWRVIKNLGRGWSHDFKYSYNLSIGVTDSYGNVSPQLTASPGQLFRVYADTSGDQLSLTPQAASSNREIQVRNDLAQGAVAACIYRDGRLLATKTGVAPGQMAAFQFKPSIYIGVVSQWDVKEGSVLDSAILTAVNQQISLVGITQGTIVMTGGGPGASSSRFTFTLIPS